jgi:hypothetical protein
LGKCKSVSILEKQINCPLTDKKSAFLKFNLVVSAHLRYETNILVNNFFSSLLVFDVINQEAQTKGTTFHFVYTQSNRLKTLFKQRNAVSTYKFYVVFRQKATIRMC